MNPLALAAVAVTLLLVLGLAAWANALTTPVHRAGRPTTSVTPVPMPTAVTPTPTPASTPTPTGTGSPEATSTPTAGSGMKASGKFDTAGVRVPATGSAGTLRRYAVRVETSARLKADRVGRQIADVLNDPRSWAGSGSVRFALVSDPDEADLTITLAAPATAAKLCKPESGSCISSGDVVIDALRWQQQGPEFAARPQWQAYLLNHAVGHLLGERHEGCGKKGKLAPVMMPQDTGLRGCTSNPWPFP